MAKDKSEVKIEGKPVFYAVLYNSMKKAALELGYALAMHGSMHSDMDLIAVAWVEDAKPIEELVQAINNCLGRTVWKEHNLKNYEERPHGRIAYTLSILGDWHIDLSVIPPNTQNKGDSLLRDLLSKSKEVIEPTGLRFNGVSEEEIKEVFKKHGVKYESPF